MQGVRLEVCLWMLIRLIGVEQGSVEVVERPVLTSHRSPGKAVDIPTEVKSIKFGKVLYGCTFY
jgi:hypothetical protein